MAGAAKRLAAVLALFALAACASAETSPTNSPAARRLAEAMRWFNPDAARRFLADVKGNPKYDYAKWAPKVEALIAHPERAGELYAGYRAAMLANPILDFDRILCVRRTFRDARAFRPDVKFQSYKLARDMGFFALNAHNHMDMRRRGFTNDVAVISDLRNPNGPRISSFYRPPDNAIVRDLDLDFDVSRLLFTSARSTNDNLLGVYEITVGNARATSREPRATLVSPGDHPDVYWWDACYLPNRDQVILLGTAGYQFLPCEQGNWPMSGLYRLDRKTGEVRQLSFDQDSNYSPAVMNDGRVMYTRWEYSDLAHYFSRELMTMNPDGVGQLALWGSGSYTPTFFYGAQCVPGEPHLLTMFGGGHHGRAEQGRMYLVDPSLARAYPFEVDPPDRTWGALQHYLRIFPKVLPKERTGLVHEFPGFGKDVEGDCADIFAANQFGRGKPYFSYPRPLSAHYHLVTMKPCPDGLLGIWLVDDFDNFTLIAESEGELLLEPIPFAPRPRPPVIPDRSVKDAKTCSVHVADVYQGPGLAGVPRGTVKKLRVFSYHYCYHLTGGHSSTGLDLMESSWDVKRILGTVDVEEDGSVCFEMPSRLPVSFQPLDSEGRALQLMRSWVVGMGGERVSCTGCHEDNRTSVSTRETIADRKFHRGEIQKIKPVDADGVRPWSFEDELWPALVKNCSCCHGDEKRAPARRADQGGDSAACTNSFMRLVYFPDAPSAWRALHPYVRRPGAETEVAMLNPMEYHASTSVLVQMLKRSHHGVSLAPDEWLRLYEWIDLNAPFWGKWNPKPFAGDKFLPCGATNQVERRLALAAEYGGQTFNPEAECDRHHEICARRLASLRPNPPPAEPSAPCATSRVVRTSVRDVPFTKFVRGWQPVVDAYALQAGAIHEAPRVTAKHVVIGDGQTMTFRLIPAGSFTMDGRETRIDKPFWMSETEVRNDQYKVFAPSHDSRYQDIYDSDVIVPGHVGNHRRMPVVRVSWNEARAFCRWLSAKVGAEVDLPSEAEWEWAARAGSTGDFPWGGVDDDFSPWANLADRGARFAEWHHNGDNGRIWDLTPYPHEINFPLHEERWKDDWFTINYVARALPNLWGLYDMHGNAAEWTRTSAAGTSAERLCGADAKIVRGGSFASRPREATSSFRLAYAPWQKVFDVGFRVVFPAE